MQRPSTYGQSPPLHHPVPQHVSSVPQLRSPPPQITPQQQQHTHPQGGAYGASPYAPMMGGLGPGPGGGAGGPGGAGMGANGFGTYGQFINDPTAAVAAQFGHTALRHGQEYVQNKIGLLPNVSALKHYFNVSNSYVARKLFLVLFPWRHKPWSRKQSVSPSGDQAWYLPPRDDINSPDMYIPVMALVTYILLSTLIAGLRGQFRPDLLTTTATTALAVVAFELIGLKLGTYILNISSESQLLDLIAYSGYKFVGIITTIAVAEVVNGGKGTGGWAGWLVFIYTVLANSLFLMRSLKYVLLPESPRSTVTGPMQTGGPMLTDSRAKRNQRTQFLFVYSYVVQALLMWILTRTRS